MAVFIICQHSQLPICEAKVVKTVKLSNEWVLRYQINDVAETVTPIKMLDIKMGKHCKAPGVYAAKFEDVLSAWRDVLAEAPEAEIDHSAVRKAKMQGYVALGCLLILCVGVMIRLMCVPFYFGFAILSGGAPSVIATIALIDKALHFEWLQDRVRAYLQKGD
jgi:hypothetical protein